jgi:Heavy metal binding domain
MKPSAMAFLLVIGCATSPQVELPELPAGHPARAEDSSISRSVAPRLVEDETTRGTASRLKGDEVPANPPLESTPAKVSYTCPMHPEIHRDGPGDCPICGMKLVVEKSPPHSH